MTPPYGSPRAASLLAFGTALLLIATVVVFGAGGVPSTSPGNLAHAANLSHAPAQATSGLTLELLEQDFAFEADGTLRLVYKLSGDLDETVELSATTTTSSTTTSTTTPPLPIDPADPATTVTLEPVPATPASATTVAPPPPLPQLTVEITNYAPIDSVTKLRSVLGSNVRSSAFDDVIDGVAVVDLRERAQFAEDGSATFTLEIETDVTDSVEQRLKFDRPGLYPIRVELLVGDPADDNVATTAGTIVQRLPGPDDADVGADSSDTVIEPPPINLAVITATPAPSSLLSATDARLATNELNEAIELAASITSPVTLEVPPPLVAAKAETAAGQEELALLTNDEFVALPLAPLDVSSAVAIGRSEVFTRLVTAGEDVLTLAAPAIPSRRDIWITSDPLSAAGAQHLRDLGVRFVVMPSELYLDTVGRPLPATDQFVNIELPDGGVLALLIVDDLAEQLTTEVADEILSTATPTEWAVETIATMLIEQANQDRLDLLARRSRVLTTPSLRAPDSRLLAGLEQLAETTPSVGFVAGSSLTGVTDVATQSGRPVSVVLPEVAGPPLAGRVELIDRTGAAMLSAASMLPEGDNRPTLWADELDALISTGYSDDEVVEATAELIAEADRLTGAVVLPEPFTFTLTGRSGSIDLDIGNRIDEPLVVQLHVSSPKVRFPEGDVSVTLRPNGETSVNIPLVARSNGTSAITVEVSTPAGEPLGEPVNLTSRVTGLTGLGQVLTGGFILVLLTWWFTHWRNKRRVALEGNGRDRHPTATK